MSSYRARQLARCQRLLEQDERALARLLVRRWRMDDASPQRRVHAGLISWRGLSAHVLSRKAELPVGETRKALADLVASGFAEERAPRRYVTTGKRIALRPAKWSSPSQAESGLSLA